MKKSSLVLGSILAVVAVVFGVLTWIQVWNAYEGRVLADTSEGEVVASGLEIPWSLDFLPDGSIVFTERPGRVRMIDPSGKLLEEPLMVIDDAAFGSENGLCGLALHPDFRNSPYVYFYYTYREGDELFNTVVRFRLEEQELTEEMIILDGIPGSTIHDAGRIKFGPDGCLYVTAGDAHEGSLAQQVDSLAGKILRLNDDGTIPEDNPFPGSPVYSLGHRDPQGLCWDSQGRLWSTEHGEIAHDEINLIEAGKNYGWPEIEGTETAEGMETPVLESGDVHWAPSGAAILDETMYFAGLRGASLFSLDLRNPSGVQGRLTGKYGRIRAVELGPDGHIYLTTSNRDGRRFPLPGDDSIIRINPSALVE